MSYLKSRRTYPKFRSKYLVESLVSQLCQINSGMVTEKSQAVILNGFKTLPSYELVKVIEHYIDSKNNRILWDKVFNGKRENIVFISVYRQDPNIFNNLVIAMKDHIDLEFIDSKGNDIFMCLLKDGDVDKLANLHLLPQPNLERRNYKGKNLVEVAELEGTNDMLEMILKKELKIKKDSIEKNTIESCKDIIF